jgi:lipopolysaccharide export system protein LptC
VRWSKVVLPSAVGVLIAVLAVAPLDRRGDVSFILDKKKVESAQERMRVETARYVGADNKGQKFEITAQRAIQRSSEVPVVDIEGMFARLALLNGPLMIAANQGQYDLDLQQVQVNGPVRVVGPDGYKLETRDVRVNLKSRQLVSSGPVSGQMRLGQFQAGRLRADLGERNVVLDGGARLKIVQGAVR